MIDLKENELYQEIEIFSDGIKAGEMEVDLKNKMLSRLAIFEPYQNKGIGQQVVALAKEKYGCNCLWVRADNDRATHVYEKLGFKKVKPTMYLMEAE
jgi:GNAT superfamily N-acetyltransferase